MIYKEFQGERISALGFGTMRLPLKGKSDADIDEELAARMFDKAIKAGVNYFDTAWGYHDHNSECVTGRILARYPRESFNLASKFPGYDLGNMTKVRQIFPKQLEKCGVEYFDFYLCRGVAAGAAGLYRSYFAGSGGARGGDSAARRHAQGIRSAACSICKICCAIWTKAVSRLPCRRRKGR